MCSVVVAAIALDLCHSARHSHCNPLRVADVDRNREARSGRIELFDCLHGPNTNESYQVPPIPLAVGVLHRAYYIAPLLLLGAPTARFEIANEARRTTEHD